MFGSEQARLSLALLTVALVACRSFEVAPGDRIDAGPGVLFGDAGGDDAAPAATDAGQDASACPSRYGAVVVDIAVGGVANQATAAERAEGEPNCGQGGGGSRSLSLGGGSIVLDIGCLYTPGNGADLRVWEASAVYPPCYGVEESYEVELSVDNVSYTELETLGVGPTAFEVGEESFRFVRISDPLPPDNDSITPGPDIDAIELLQAP